MFHANVTCIRLSCENFWNFLVTTTRFDYLIKFETNIFVNHWFHNVWLMYVWVWLIEKRKIRVHCEIQCYLLFFYIWTKIWLQPIYTKYFNESIRYLEFTDLYRYKFSHANISLPTLNFFFPGACSTKHPIIDSRDHRETPNHDTFQLPVMKWTETPFGPLISNPVRLDSEGFYGTHYVRVRWNSYDSQGGARGGIASLLMTKLKLLERRRRKFSLLALRSFIYFATLFLFMLYDFIPSICNAISVASQENRVKFRAFAYKRPGHE